MRDPEGRPKTVDLWTGCYTPRELRMLMDSCGFTVSSISSVDPGRYAQAPATTESSEFLVVAFASPFRREGGPTGPH